MLHLLATQHHALCFDLLPCFTPANTNHLADCCSRLFHLNDTAFLQHMNAMFPIKQGWTLVQPPSDLLLNMNYALLNRLPPKECPWPTSSNRYHVEHLGRLLRPPALRPLPGTPRQPHPIVTNFCTSILHRFLGSQWVSSPLSTVEGALRVVVQTFTTLGNINPRLTPSGKLDLWLSHQLSAYKKEDLPPSCVKPIPFPIIPQTANLCCTANTPIAHTITDMLLLFFFYLL